MAKKRIPGLQPLVRLTAQGLKPGEPELFGTTKVVP